MDPIREQLYGLKNIQAGEAIKSLLKESGRALSLWPEKAFNLPSRYGFDVDVLPTTKDVLAFLSLLPAGVARHFLCLVARKFQLIEFGEGKGDFLFWERPVFLVFEPERKNAYISLEEWLMENGVTGDELAGYKTSKSYPHLSICLTTELLALLRRIIYSDIELTSQMQPEVGLKKACFPPWNSYDSERKVRPADTIRDLLSFYVGQEVGFAVEDMAKIISQLEGMQRSIGKFARHEGCADTPQFDEAMAYITAFNNYLRDQIEERLIG